VDEASYRKYTSLPEGPLRSLIVSSIQPNSSRDGKIDASNFAAVRMKPHEACSLLSGERLCRIHIELGEAYLCRACAVFPRITHTIDGFKETKLSLSCPEAARLVLLEPHLLPPRSAPGHQVTWDETAANQAPLRVYFWQIREFVLALIQNRNYPLWQRMFLLGTFSRRLDALVRGEVTRSFPDLLDDFSRAVTAGGLSDLMEKIPANNQLQLEIVLRLVARRVDGVWSSPRLRTVLNMFVEGVGLSPETSTESQAARYAAAYAEFYQPFFGHHPHMLENYLVNAVLLYLFPFQGNPSAPQADVQPARAFALLAIQFAFIKGLLIGVAGARKHAFSAADVVETVQTAFKHFEHRAHFLPEALASLEARSLDNAQGLTMLLRN
jgi:lysine-N-methylase